MLEYFSTHLSNILSNILSNVIQYVPIVIQYSFIVYSMGFRVSFTLVIREYLEPYTCVYAHMLQRGIHSICYSGGFIVYATAGDSCIQYIVCLQCYRVWEPQRGISVYSITSVQCYRVCKKSAQVARRLVSSSSVNIVTAIIIL